MTTPASIPLVIVQGSTYEKPLWYKNKVDGVVTPVDLTGYSARAKIQSHPLDEPYTLELTTENGGLEIDGPAGEIMRRITATQTDGMAFTRPGRWQLEIWAGSFVKRLVDGPVPVDPKI